VLEAQAGAMSRLVVRDEPVGPYRAAFAGPDGAEIDLSDFAGKIVFVNFWATWCAPCLKEMPSIDRLAAAMEGEDFAVVALSTDRGSAERPQAWFDANGIETLRLYHDPKGALPREAGVTGIPMTLLLDRQGREVARFLGDAEWDSDEAKAIIAAMIAEK
jgi:thiol-disulfide isomerase/thioredoxin